MKMKTARHKLIIPGYENDPIDITGIQFHSQKVLPGSIFVAIRGNLTDGHDYIKNAIEAGAAAIIGEKHIEGLAVPYYRVDNARKALADASASYYGYPSKKHKIIGITGTNGKTTTAFMLWHILHHAGVSSSLLSTVSTMINGKETDSTSTTPDALKLQEALSQSDDEYVVMEVSSHGIDQQRVRGIDFDVAIFTNLSHEHLDYHKDMQSYYRTKRSMFEQVKEDGYTVVNTDCPWGRQLYEDIENSNNVITYGSGEKDIGPFITLQQSNTMTGQFRIKEGTSFHDVQICLPGIHNIYNAIAAFTAARKLGLEADTISDALRTFQGIPGRFERFSHPSDATIIVDYAHTPDGIQHLLKTSRELCNRKLTHIFGFRGRRDSAKRIDMLKQSLSYCDRVILTTDDLNEENDLFMQVKSLTDQLGSSKCEIIEDRTLAIKQAWNDASQGDWVAISGKGPETYKHSFYLPTKTDRETIQFLLNQ